jgi:hypothetical protein
LNERAELYALGYAGEAERAEIERHAATCASCREALAAAEATVLRLIEEQASVQSDEPDLAPLQLRAPRRNLALPIAAALALAASIAIAIFNWNDLRATREQQAQQQLAMTAMIQGHFLHAPLSPVAPGAPHGKVIYGRTGGWAYVIVEGGTQSFDVVDVDAAGRHTVATIPAQAGPRAAFVRLDAPPTAIELSANGTTVASARVATVKER